MGAVEESSSAQPSGQRESAIADDAQKTNSAESLEVAARVFPDEVGVGEETTYSIEYPEGLQVEIVPPSFGELSVVRAKRGQAFSSKHTKDKEGKVTTVDRRRWIETWKVKAPREGTFAIGPAEVRLKDQVARTEPVELYCVAPHDRPVLKVSVAARTLTVGASTEYALEVTNPIGVQMRPPDFGELRAKGPRVTEQTATAGQSDPVRTKVYTWEISGTRTGRHPIGSPEVSVNGTTLTADAIVIDVTD